MGHVPHAAVGKEAHEPAAGHFAKDMAYKALGAEREHFPRAMPPPGYAGHLHGTNDSVAAFGTSRWAPKEPPSRKPKVLDEAQMSGWPATSGVLLASAAPKMSAEELAAKHAKTIATLGRF